jgi:hypothetical protein
LTGQLIPSSFQVDIYTLTPYQLMIFLTDPYQLGEPPVFAAPKTPRKLHEDSGTYYRDQNASRYPNYPMEPIIRAIQTEKPDYDLQESDIIACGSTMGNLLRFARGSDKPFRILIEAVGETVFFLRRENSPLEIIPDVHGYGHSFPEAYTAWSSEVRGSESHQRVVSYEFSTMKVLVRFEGDGFLSEHAQDYEHRSELAPLSPSSGSVSASGENGSSTETELLASMAKVAVSSVYPTDKTEPNEALGIERRGRTIPQSAIKVFDLKTRSIKKKHVDTLNEELPRLWVAQIPNFMLAHHEFGVFKSIEVRDTTQSIKEWEEENQETLVRFAGLLKRLVAFARSIGKFEIVREVDSKELELREQGGNVRGVLPPDLMERWDSSI